MASDLTFEEHEGFLLCSYHGLFELDELTRAGLAIYASCDARGFPAVLVDLTGAEEHGLSVPDRYRFLNWLAAGRRFDVRVAVVMLPDQGLPGERWRAAAQERGVPIRVFSHRTPARAWLLQGREAGPRTANDGPAAPPPPPRDRRPS